MPSHLCRLVRHHPPTHLPLSSLPSPSLRSDPDSRAAGRILIRPTHTPAAAVGRRSFQPAGTRHRWRTAGDDGLVAPVGPEEEEVSPGARPGGMTERGRGDPGPAG